MYSVLYQCTPEILYNVMGEIRNQGYAKRYFIRTNLGTKL